ncbi:MAG: three-Cys-motif partner protein TcmP, partial [Magnetococcales bacterium]|nr:three-Cys-motif partner protein TcmP [Magnetococcales bacterium]
DANEKIQSVCKNFKIQKHRAVLFLDPFGMQVSWDTFKSVAGTQCIDMWLLFPVSAVARMLPNDGNIREEWQKKLDDFFGDRSWKEEFYKTSKTRTLFDDKPVTFSEKIANTAIIQESITKRLKDIFPEVLDKPLLLNNSKNSPLFSRLCKSHFLNSNHGCRGEAQEAQARVLSHTQRFGWI